MPESSHLREHIDLIARHEREFSDRRTHSERVGDAIGALIGSLWFMGIRFLWIALWIGLNSLHSTPHFDGGCVPVRLQHSDPDCLTSQEGSSSDFYLRYL